MNHPSHQRGLSLVELLVSLAIGVVLIAGALSVYISGRATYTLNETIARMQENAAFALKYIEQDVRQAGLWGTHNQTASVVGRATDNPSPVTLAAGECEANWAVDLDAPLEGHDNGVPGGWSCFTNYGGTGVPETDVLTIRRVEPRPVAAADLEADRIYIRSSITPNGAVFLGNNQPAGFAPNARNYPLRVHSYYVSPNSLADNATATVPALRRLELINGPAMRDTEVITGVESFHVQFGIRDEDDPIGGAVAYVRADSNLLNPGQNTVVVAVRVWVLVRSDLPEAGYEDNATYAMGDEIFTVPDDVRDHRRLLVTRTFDVRNQI
ncbi:MAG: PilW family protein [Gammaproteobacteria bacterium]